MISFENLKSQWDNQTEIEVPNNGAQLIIKKTNALKRKQRITNMVLGATVIVLTGFFFYIAAYNNVTVALALLLMVGVLLIRMILERFSIGKLKKMNLGVDAVAYKQSIVNYYKNRIRTHYIFTPIIFLFYITGFIILLPFFKQNSSVWFYNYILVSGSVFIVVIIFFIRKQILKELFTLRALKE